MDALISKQLQESAYQDFVLPDDGDQCGPNEIQATAAEFKSILPIPSQQDMWQVLEQTPAAFKTEDGQTVLKYKVVAGKHGPDCMQSGQQAENNMVTAFHGTSLQAVHGIISNGLMPSEKSHNVTGIWCSTKFEYCLEYSKFIVQPCTGVVIAFRTQEGRLESRARWAKFMPTKKIVITAAGEQAPIIITGIYIRIPGPNRLQWYLSFMDMVNDIGHQSFVNLPAWAPTEVIAWTLKEHVKARAIHIGSDGWLGLGYGAGQSFTVTGISKASIKVCSILRANAADQPAKRRKYLKEVKWEDYPLPMQKWIMEQYPGLGLKLQADATQKGHHEVYELGTIIPADKWSYKCD